MRRCSERFTALTSAALTSISRASIALTSISRASISRASIPLASIARASVLACASTIGSAAAMACMTTTDARAQNVTLTQPVLRIGTADGDSTQILFGAHSVARTSTGAVVVANMGTSQVRVYDRSGRLARSIGRKGQGPGEFQFLQEVGVIRGDTVVTYDVGLGRITIFTPAGKVARTVQVQPLGNGVLPQAVGFTDDGRMLAHTDFARVFSAGEHRDTLTYVLYDVKGSPVDTLGRYPGPEEFHLVGNGSAVRRDVPFGRNSFAAVAGGRIAIGSNDAYRFDIFNSSAKRVVTHSESRSAVKTTKEHRAQLDRDYLEGMPASFRDGVAKRVHEFPSRETYPYYEGLLASADGAVWTAELMRPGAKTRLWTVRKPDGSPPREIRVPASVQLLAVGPDYALGREKDEAGIESILVYSLPRTTR